MVDERTGEVRELELVASFYQGKSGISISGDGDGMTLKIEIPLHKPNGQREQAMAWAMLYAGRTFVLRVLDDPNEGRGSGAGE